MGHSVNLICEKCKKVTKDIEITETPYIFRCRCGKEHIVFYNSLIENYQIEEYK